MKRKDLQNSIEPLSTDELWEAEIWLLKRDQSACFAKEIAVFERQKSRLIQPKMMLVSKSSSLYTLSPFLDEGGLVRLGGRLERSPLLYGYQHRIILGKRIAFSGSYNPAISRRSETFGVNTVCNLRQRY